MNLLRTAGTITLLAALLAACAKEAPPSVTEAAALAPQPQAPLTTIYVNGEIITVNDGQPTAEAVAVRAGRILAVGSRAEVEAVAGKNTKLRDLKGATLLPGFIDSHGHISFTNKLQLSANLASPPVGTAETISDVLDLLREHQQKQPEADWILGFSYDDSLLAENRHPTRDELDQVSNEIPIAITHVSGHLMSCNSKCLDLAGINADSQDPPGGIIRREAGSQEPDGVLEETAMYALMKVLPVPDVSAQVDLMAKTQRDYASYGITTAQEGAAMQESLDILAAAAEQGALFLDVMSFPHTSLGMEGLKQNAPTPYSNHYRIGGIKIILDGSPQGKTAWLTEPYYHPPQGKSSDYKGYPTFQDEEVQPFFDYAMGNDIPLLAHANGDAAADQMIRAVASASAKFGKKDRRPVMIHAQTAREDQIDRMIEEGIVPSYFVAHTFYWGDWHRDSVFGVERASRISPLRSSSDKGLHHTIHNDTPVVPADMMRLLWTAVNRVTRSGQVLGEAQRATVMEGIKAMTIEGAYQFFEEDSKGSIEVGKRADLVILEKNPLSVDPLDIKGIAVLETIKDGETVFTL
jgi:hypothetical protein